MGGCYLGVQVLGDARKAGGRYYQRDALPLLLLLFLDSVLLSETYDTGRDIQSVVFDGQVLSLKASLLAQPEPPRCITGNFVGNI